MQMQQLQYGVIANGKAIENVTITSFVDWEDIAAHAMAEEKSGKKLPIMPIHRNALQKRMAEDGSTETRLFPVAA